MRGEKPIVIIVALAAIFMWSTVATAFKLGLQTYSPYELVFWATLCSTVVLLALALLRHGTKVFATTSVYSGILYSVLGGLLNPFLYYLVLFYAYSLLPARIAQPIAFTWPIILTVFISLFIRKHFSLNILLPLILSFLGFIVLSVGAHKTSTDVGLSFNGVFLCLLCAIIWSTYWLFSLKDKRKELIKLFWYFFTGFCSLLLYGLFTQKLPDTLHAWHILYPVYIGLFEMSVSFFLWLTALKSAKNVALLSNLVYFTPVLSLFFIRLILEEYLEATTFIGLGLIMGGVLLSTKDKVNSKKIKAKPTK